MNSHPSWCTACQNGPTKPVGATHAWCTNCGVLYGERGPVMPTKIGPDPRERRIAWDKYASSVQTSLASSEAGAFADRLLAERDKRFSSARSEARAEDKTNG